MGRARSPYMTEDKRKKEVEANLFAFLLLMPEKNIREDLKEIGEVDLMGNCDKQIAKLASKYKVTSVMMTMRLTILYDKGY